MAANAYDELKWRGMLFDSTEGVQEMLANEIVPVYNGFDVTADSLHVGHIVPLIALARLQRFGHLPIAVAGGGTTMLGDPSGKTIERQLLPYSVIAENTEAVSYTHLRAHETRHE